MFRKQNFRQKKVFWYQNTILALFGPFQALFGPFFTLFNEEKTPFLALVCEIFTPISSLCLHLPLARLAG